MATALEVAETILGSVKADPRWTHMLIETVAASQSFPKYTDDEGNEPLTQEERDEIQAEYSNLFEESVDELAAAWGDPYYFCPAEDNPNPWGGLGWEDACWERGEFVVCLFFCQDDAELPFAVSVAVVRPEAWEPDEE